MILYTSKLIQNKLWPVGQVAKTPPSHGGIRGSIPLQATSKKQFRFLPELFFYFKIDIGLKFFLFVKIIKRMFDGRGVIDMNNIIVIPLLAAVLGSILTAFLMVNTFKKERRKYRKEHLISINNDKIKDYKAFFQLNKRLRTISEKIRNKAIPNWINVESYYRDEFISQYEDLLDEYEFTGSYMEKKEVCESAITILRMSRGIVKELKERENYGSTSDEIEGESDRVIKLIISLEKSILARVIELTREKSKIVSGK